MSSKDMGTWKAHCLPLDKPELCKSDSWFQLNDLVDTGDVKLCGEKGSFYYNSLQPLFYQFMWFLYH